MTEVFDGRNYEKDVPAGSNLPLCLWLHGGGGDGLTFRTQLGFSSTLTDNAVMIYPYAESNGTTTVWNAGPIADQPEDDLTWLEGLIDQVITDESIDTAKIYMMGHSNGGMMTHRYSSESIRQPFARTIAKSFTINAALIMTEAYSYTNELYSISSASDVIVPVLGNTVYRSDIFEYVQTAGDVAARSEFRTLVGSSHAIASVKTALTDLDTSLEAESIRLFEL